jgi:protein ImuB
LRDYFLARSEQAGLLWIYRERLTAGRLETDKPAGHWYLHGVFG